MRNSGSDSDNNNLDSVSRSWLEFKKLCASDLDCLKEFARRLFELCPKSCRFCEGVNLQQAGDLRYLNCLDCNRNTSLTAGTFFHGVTRFQAWFGAIWLLEKGLQFNALRFSKLAEVSYDTAWRILRKIKAVLCTNFEDESEMICSSMFSRIFIRRSVETPAGKRPICEQIVANEKAMLDEIDAPNRDLSAVDIYILEKTTAKPEPFDSIVFDSEFSRETVISSLISLELDGLIERLPGDKYMKVRSIKFNSDQAYPPSLLEKIEDSVARIREIFQGISRKYLQYYLAGRWCCEDRTRWGAGKVLQACAQAGVVLTKTVREYNSPFVVFMFAK